MAKAAPTDDVETSVFDAKLAGEIVEITRSESISRAKKERLISSAVRDAVLTATEPFKDPADILKVALSLTTAAAQAAPSFTDTIARSVAFAGPVVGIDSAGPRIRAAAFAAAKSPRGRRSEPNSRELETAGPPSPGEPRTDSPATDLIGAPTRLTRHSQGADDPSASSSNAVSTQGLQLGDNSTLSLSAAVAVTHDSNIYLKSRDSNQVVSETITSVTPGVTYRFGQNSLAHGSVGYKAAFTSYADKTSSNVTLGTGNADFGYDSGTLAIDGSASYQQLNQATVGGTSSANTIVRQNVLAVATSVEPTLTAKTSVQTGASIDWTEYKTPGFIGSKNITVPLKAFFEATPKLAVSAGVSLGQTNPQGDGPNSRDLFYNVGFRGNLTEKLTSNFSVGYRTRKVSDQPSEGFWGLDGSFNYQLTPKTGLGLVATRNFSVGSAGESLKSGSYYLDFNTAPTLDWEFAATIGYRETDYGASVFLPKDLKIVPAPSGRRDSYGEGKLSATYLFTRWLNATAVWTHRLNRSNDNTAEYADDLLSLLLVFQY